MEDLTTDGAEVVVWDLEHVEEMKSELLAPLQTSDVTIQEGVGGGISSNGGGGVSKLALEQLIAVPNPIQLNGLEIFGDNADPALNICTNLLKSYL